MILKKNVTGFFDQSDTPTKVDLEEIKSIVYALEFTKIYKIKEFKEPEQNRNYFKITLLNLTTNDNVCILINGQYPYYCGVICGRNWMNNTFIELPSTLRNCLDTKFDFFTPADLNAVVNTIDLKELSNAELKQIQYWKSKTFGEIIFNGYD